MQWSAIACNNMLSLVGLFEIAAQELKPSGNQSVQDQLKWRVVLSIIINYETSDILCRILRI